MTPRARSKFGAPIFETDLSEANVAYHVEKILVTLLGLFGTPQSFPASCSDSAPGKCASPVPLYTSLLPSEVL